MKDEEVRVAALNAAVAWYKGCCNSNEDLTRLPRQVVIDTASRFEEYIRTGK